MSDEVLLQHEAHCGGMIKFTRAACPHPTLPAARLRADVQATPVDNPGLKH